MPHSPDDSPDDFAAYAHARLPELVTTAHLLSGGQDDPAAPGDPREATELVRRTLVQVCARWRRIPRDDVDFYVRRSLVKEYLRRTRRGRTRSARQRAVLVLLHWEGLTEAETAQLLGCSTGAVRSRARRGLAVYGGDAERLRELFTEAAESAASAESTSGGVPFDVPFNVPFNVPLDAVEQRGRALRRRRRGVLVAGCALLLVPAVVFGVGGFMGAGSADGSGGGASDVAQSPTRIVAPGERVDAVTGVQVWLTTDGKHWSAPERPNQFRGLTDNRDGDGDGDKGEGKPGVSAQLDPMKSGYFLSGLYRGLSADPARVEVTVDDRRITGTVLTLAGSPGWGVWYARAPLTPEELKSSSVDGGPTVTVYDAAGKAVARGGADE